MKDQLLRLNMPVPESAEGAAPERYFSDVVDDSENTFEQRLMAGMVLAQMKQVESESRLFDSLRLSRGYRDAIEWYMSNRPRTRDAAPSLE